MGHIRSESLTQKKQPDASDSASTDLFCSVLLAPIQGSSTSSPWPYSHWEANMAKTAKKRYEKFLLLAAKSNHAFIVSALLDRTDVDFNARTGHGQTALSLAAENGHAEVVELLLSRHDSDLNAQDLDGQTPLGWAVLTSVVNGHATVVAILVHNPEVRIDVRDVEGRTPLSWAVINRQDLILRVLLERLGLRCDLESREALYRSEGEPAAVPREDNKHSSSLAIGSDDTAMQRRAFSPLPSTSKSSTGRLWEAEIVNRQPTGISRIAAELQEEPRGCLELTLHSTAL
jgi:ankyrin repeat protein